MTFRKKVILNEIDQLIPIAQRLSMLVPLKGSNGIPIQSRSEFDNAYNASMKIQKLENELING